MIPLTSGEAEDSYLTYQTDMNRSASIEIGLLREHEAARPQLPHGPGDLHMLRGAPKAFWDDQ